MSLTEQLKKKLQQIQKYIPVSELPNRIELKLTAYAFKQDKKGNESLFLTLETKEGAYVIQKYTKSCYEDLFNAIEKAGGEDHLRNNYHTWILERRGKSYYARLYPLPLDKPKK